MKVRPSPQFTTHHHMKRTPPTLPSRVPYPKTPEQARAWLRERGVPLTHLARANQISRYILTNLLSGKLKGLRGKTHRGAIVLGLKKEPKA